MTALVLSVFIELSQFIFNLVWCEVDDVINNTLGTMIGWGVWWMIKTLGRARKEKVDN